MPRFVAFAAMLFLAMTGGAFAQDLCKDILINGTLSREIISQNTFVQQWLSSRYKEKNENENNTDTSAGATIPGAEMVMSGNYNRTDYNRYLKEVSSSLDLATIYKNETSVLLASGDPAIVSAWGACMDKGRGLSVTFSPQAPRTSFLTIKWYAYPVAPNVSTDTELTADVVVDKPGVKVNSGQECLKKGAVLKDRVPCQVILEFENAAIDLAVAVSTVHGSETAYLPPRIKLVPERKGYVPDPKANEVGGYTLSTNKDTGTKCHDAPAGWNFVTEAVAVKTRIDGTMTRSRCTPVVSTLASDKVCFYMHMGHTGKDAWCYGHMESEIIQWNKVESLN